MLGVWSEQASLFLGWVCNRLLAAVTTPENSASSFACLQMESIYSAKCWLLSEARLCIREMLACFDKQLSVACFKKGVFYLSGSKIMINSEV